MCAGRAPPAWCDLRRSATRRRSGQGEEIVHDAAHALGFPGDDAECSGGLGRRGATAERDLGVRAEDGRRRFEFVAGVDQEAAHLFNHGLHRRGGLARDEHAARAPHRAPDAGAAGAARHVCHDGRLAGQPPQRAPSSGDRHPLPQAGGSRQLAMVIGHWALRGFGLWTTEKRATGLFIGPMGCYEPRACGWPFADAAARWRGRIAMGARAWRVRDGPTPIEDTKLSEGGEKKCWAAPRAGRG